MMEHHFDEVKRRKEALKEALGAKASKRRARGAADQDSLGYRIPDKRDVDPRDDRSVAQQMVVDFLEAYHSRVGIPRVVGRTRWYTTANLMRVVVGFHLPRVDYTR
jgi:Rps23 Pro-64 3,4-dihydroxylase Tpa1-like proline 4-hydroxylase